MRLQRKAILYVASIATGLAVWEVTAGFFSRIVLAPPSAVAVNLYEGVLTGQLTSALAGAFTHMLVGYVLALCVAIPLGFLIGRRAWAYMMFEPLVNAMFAIPSIAFVPFIIIWFGLFYEARVALVFTMCFFDVLVTVAAGARNVESSLVDAGRSFGVRGLQMFSKVLMPASMPFLAAAARIGLARAVNAMIAAELFFAAVNLGAYMVSHANNFDSAGVLAVICVLCGVGLVTQEGLKWLEAKLLPWHVRG